MQWELITDIILIISIITFVIFLCLGVYQWITRGSIKQVDKQLRWLPLPAILVAITYFIFDYLIILNTRPNGSGEPSFPSTHVMIVTTIFFVVTIILPKYIKNKTVRIILEAIMVILISLTCIGRVYANMHWIVDVIGGLAFGFVFSEIYYLTFKKKKKYGKHIQ